MSCECCRERGAIRRLTHLMGRTYQAQLCGACAGARHGRDQCRLCGAFVWRCATLAHFADVHPLTLARVANDPANAYGILGQPAPAPEQTKIGTLHFQPDGSLPE